MAHRTEFDPWSMWLPRDASSSRPSLSSRQPSRTQSGPVGEFLSLAVEPGGESSNTPPQNLHAGGEDWLEVCLYVHWQPEKWERLTSALEIARSGAAKNDDTASGALAYVSGLGSDGHWFLHPAGYRLGDKTKGPMVKWKLERAGVRVGILNRPTPHETIPNVHVVISGDVLLASGGLDALWPRVREWIADLGAEIIEDKVSRVDAALDMAGVDVLDFYEAFARGDVITRAKRAREFGEAPWQVHRSGRRVTGLSIGRSPMVRIYDKLAECTDPDVRAALVQTRWGGNTPEKATRIEFQLRGEFLKEGRWLGYRKNPLSSRRVRAVVSVADWIAQRAAIVEYLTTRWLRFVRPGSDRRHTERATNHPTWERVVESMRRLWARVKDFAVKIDHRQADPSALLNQVRGCLERVAAIWREDIQGAEDFVGFAVDALAKHVEGDGGIRDRILAKLGSLAMPRPDPIPI